tara:strand:+ start:5318 stop:8917 length:3600 start_codon:yes stop_codon:yes gene_type:complete
MPEIKNTFVKGKMNKDLDERLIEKGTYREAQNIAISESADSDTGAVEIIKGNVKRTNNFSQFSGFNVIGKVDDIKNKRIFFFVSNFTGEDNENIRRIKRARGAGSNHTGSTTFSNAIQETCAILMYNVESETVQTLVEGPFLNFSKKHLITGAQIIDNLLFFTDDYNQPRKINVARALENSAHYTLEEQISISKYAPYLPIRLVNRFGFWTNDNNNSTSDTAGDKKSGTIKSEYMRDKFLRFSYRYKYEDGEYSTIAPFTQVVFEPLNNALIDATDTSVNTVTNEPEVLTGKANLFRKTTVDIMQNAINSVVLRIPMPQVNERDTNNNTNVQNGVYANDYKITDVDIIIKEAGGIALRVVKTLKMSQQSSSNFDFYESKASSGGDQYKRHVLKYVYKSEEPYKVLPEDQLTRVYDQVPIKAKALEIVGNRVVFGNYLENYDYPLDAAGTKGINYTLGVIKKGDDEFNASHGLIQYTKNQYKFHNIKQRRTYQVGIVFADKFGRQSPVILSSSTDDNADTFTVPPNTQDLSTLFNTDYSWSTNQAAFGQALRISFADSQLFSNNSNIYDSEFNAGYNPHGWYSYKIVVKQNEQEYYNIYAPHPFNGWDNIDNEPDFALAGGKSWLALLGDNINKVPRAINDSDINRPGVAGSEEFLYPKVVFKTNSGTGAGADSALNTQLHELVDVISLGNAFEQSLFISPKDNSSGTSGFSVYNFIYAKEKNPLIAELPNLSRYIGTTNSAQGNGNAFFAYVHADTSDDFNAVITNSNNTTIAAAYNNDPDGYMVNGSRIENKGKPVLVRNFDAGTKTVTFDTKQTLKAGDYLIFSLYDEGLSVFETEPFKSKIDIYYETGTCGLVQDLNEELSGNTAQAGSPTITGLSNDTFPESTTANTAITTVQATDNTGSSNLSFSIITAETGNNLDVSGKLTINSSTGVISTTGAFAFKNTSEDTITVRVGVNDPDTQQVFADLDLSVVNSAPTFTNSNPSESVTILTSPNTVIHTQQVTNGAALIQGNSSGLSVTKNFNSAGANQTAYNNMFSVQLVGNTLSVKTTTSATQSALTSFFADNTTNARQMTITLNDGMPSTNTATATLTITQGQAGISGTLIISSGVCEPCNPSGSQTFYAIQNTGNSQPSVYNGYLNLVVNNKVYTNSNLTTLASQGHYLAEYSGTQEYECYSINSSGVVVSVSEIQECDDRES